MGGNDLSHNNKTKEWSMLPSGVMAMQMTLIEQELFRDVLPAEFMKESWHSPHREALSPRLAILVKRFNEVIKREKYKRRHN